MSKLQKLLVSCAALAACQFVIAAPVVSPTSWTGFYVGVNGGYGWGKGDVSLNSDFDLLPPEGGFPHRLANDARGGLFGVQVGLNHRMGGNVVGLELDYDWANVRDSSNFSNDFLFLGQLAIPYDIHVRQSLNSLGSFRLRAGVLGWDHVLFYLTGGFAFGETRISGSMEAPLLPAVPLTFNGHHSYTYCQAGFVAGLGVEVNIMGNWSGKVEYLYYNLGSRHNLITTIPTITQEVKFRGDVVRAGINYNFM